MNCQIHPVLYHFFLRLKDTLCAEIVHRRKRPSRTCIEIIYNADGVPIPTGRLNTLREAEKWGFWVIGREQTKPERMIYRGRRVYQLFLSPVHPKKRREMKKTIIPLHQTNSMAMIA